MQLGDNYSKWSYMHYMIQGVLQFQMFHIPMVGADTCGFAGKLFCFLVPSHMGMRADAARTRQLGRGTMQQVDAGRRVHALLP
jgi:hypothetical protein